MAQSKAVEVASDESDIRRSPSNRSIKRTLKRLDSLAKAVLVPEAVTQTATSICAKALNRRLVLGRTRSMLAASSLYAACREKDIPVSLETVATASGMGRDNLARNYRMLVRELDLKIPVSDPTEYVAIVASRTRLTPEVQADAMQILSHAQKAGIINGKDPAGVAASALYVAAAREGQKLTQREAAEAAGVAEVTIRKAYKSLRVL